MCMAGDFTVFSTALFRFALKCGMFGNIHIFTSLSNMSNISQHQHCTPQRYSVTRDPDVRNWKRTYTAVPTLRNSHTPACLIAKHGSRSATRTRSNASIRSSRSRYWYMFLLLLHRYRRSTSLVLQRRSRPRPREVHRDQERNSRRRPPCGANPQQTPRARNKR